MNPREQRKARRNWVVNQRRHRENLKTSELILTPPNSPDSAAEDIAPPELPVIDEQRPGASTNRVASRQSVSAKKTKEERKNKA